MIRARRAEREQALGLPGQLIPLARAAEAYRAKAAGGLPGRIVLQP